MEAITIGVIVMLVIGLTGIVSDRLRIASPILLVVLGIVVSVLPFIPDIEIEPELILAGILPPLLYSSAVAMPTMNFRRDLGAISGLAVLLVILSSVCLGLLAHLLIPEVSLWWGIALGAVISPTDAVATSIAKRAGVSPRIRTILEGESLLNDATALTLLRTAIASAAISFSLWQAIGQFAYSVVVAALIGWAVGRLNVLVRSLTKSGPVSTVISLTVPFWASIPAEHLGASGLVAAVVAGLITGNRAVRELPPQVRETDHETWRTLELMLESAVFLMMGVQLSSMVNEVHEAEHVELWLVALIALALLAATVVIRTIVVVPLVAWQQRSAERKIAGLPRMKLFQARVEQIAEYEQNPDNPRLDGPDAWQRFRESIAQGSQLEGERGVPELDAETRAKLERLRAGQGQDGEIVRRHAAKRGKAFARRLAFKVLRRRRKGFEAENLSTRLRRYLADTTYLTRQPLNRRDSAVIVWAGMRGAVTVAAAQTLPAETPHRALLVLVAFAVATMSLVGQGLTLAAFIRWVKPTKPDPAELAADEQRVQEVMWGVMGDERPKDNVEALDLIARQRDALLDLRAVGEIDAEVLENALEALDAREISVRLVSRGADD